MLFTESKTRTVVKAITWKLLAISITGAVAYAYTGEWGLTGKITGVAAALTLIAYYFHERIWDRVTRGRSIRGY